MQFAVWCTYCKLHLTVVHTVVNGLDDIEMRNFWMSLTVSSFFFWRKHKVFRWVRSLLSDSFSFSAYCCTSSVSLHPSSLHFILGGRMDGRMKWRDSLIIYANAIFPFTPFSIYCFPLSRCQLLSAAFRTLRFSKRANQKVISCN